MSAPDAGEGWWTRDVMFDNMAMSCPGMISSSGTPVWDKHKAEHKVKKQALSQRHITKSHCQRSHSKHQLITCIG